MIGLSSWKMIEKLLHMAMNQRQKFCIRKIILTYIHIHSMKCLLERAKCRGHFIEHVVRAVASSCKGAA
jgi:hypothetical protein